MNCPKCKKGIITGSISEEGDMYKIISSRNGSETSPAQWKNK